MLLSRRVERSRDAGDENRARVAAEGVDDGRKDRKALKLVHVGFEDES